MAKYKKVPVEVSLHLRYLHQDMGITCSELCKRYPAYASRSIYRHSKLPIGCKPFDKRKHNAGRPRKLTFRDIRRIKMTFPRLREHAPSFTSKKVKLEAGIGNDVSNKTVRRCMNNLGYHYCQSRKKGLLSKEDMKVRQKFARKVKKILREDFWMNGISFYLDGVGFAHKYNPKDQAGYTTAMQWRKKSEGIKLSGKGKKEGTGGRVANFIVAISYKKGVICCEQYHGSITGESFAEFIQQNFPKLFEVSINPKGKLFLQDGDPRQNSKKAKDAMDEVGCRLFSIPARSPDINPIENIFHLVRRKLEEDAISSNITRETFDQFSERVKKTFYEFPSVLIDKTIESMNGRMTMIIEGKGQRTKY